MAKPQKMKAYASFAEWRADQSSENQKLIDALSELVEETAPGFEQGVKWGQGCWTLDGTPKVYIHTEPDHVQLGFYAGSTLQDPERLLFGKGKHVRHVKVFSAEEISKAALVGLLKQVL